MTVGTDGGSDIHGEQDRGRKAKDVEGWTLRGEQRELGSRGGEMAREKRRGRKEEGKKRDRTRLRKCWDSRAGETGGPPDIPEQLECPSPGGTAAASTGAATVTA